MTNRMFRVMLVAVVTSMFAVSIVFGTDVNSHAEQKPDVAATFGPGNLS